MCQPEAKYSILTNKPIENQRQLKQLEKSVLKTIMTVYILDEQNIID